jgi:tagatose-1,6-bisphosphate aldolase non-catalytic subunit AgaZ/GatZ
MKKVSMSELVNAAGELNATLLGIGPMTETVIRASLELGRDEDFPVIFIASRNQIDSKRFGGGYVGGWDQREFVRKIKGIADEVGFDGLLYICRDHGGPWQRDEEMKGKLDEREAMERARISLEEDIKSGFNLLHIDPTKDPFIAPPIPFDLVIRRTIELIEFTEEVAGSEGVEVEYEIGTEETRGGLTASDAFEDFIERIFSALDSKGLRRPCFIVGQTGTLVRMDENVGSFNPEKARELAGIASKYGLGFKEHNADYLPYEQLSMHPELGITAANVAPEFGVAETRAYLALSKIDPEGANFASLLERVALESGRWKKWLKEEMKGISEEEIASNSSLLRKITEISGHYVFDDERVKEAKGKLLRRLRAPGAVDNPEEKVKEEVKKAIGKYVRAFNLSGITSKI